MPVRIDNQTCYFTLNAAGEEQRRAASAVTVSTDSAKAMSYVALDAERIYITEAEADALTVAGARDARKHVKADSSDSLI